MVQGYAEITRRIRGSVFLTMLIYCQILTKLAARKEREELRRARRKSHRHRRDRDRDQDSTFEFDSADDQAYEDNGPKMLVKKVAMSRGPAESAC